MIALGTLLRILIWVSNADMAKKIAVVDGLQAFPTILREIMTSIKVQDPDCLVELLDLCIITDHLAASETKQYHQLDHYTIHVLVLQNR